MPSARGATWPWCRIRNIRWCALKTPPAGRWRRGAAESLRTRVKAVELEAERLQQEALYNLVKSGRLGRPAPPHGGRAARDSVSSYQGVIGPFPPEPLEAVLTAFAKFEAPGRDRAE